MPFMVCLYLGNSDPCFCLAAEEYLIKNYGEDIFLIWQSHNAVIVGKHQNALAEINYRFIRGNNISVTRRISGGGTVFHDRGNVNFTFIKNVSGPSEISFKIFTRPIIEFLKVLEVKAETSGRNDLVVAGNKISGNAEHVYKNRVLHHGTLLFDSDLVNLGNAIRVVAGKYIGKAVQSNRAVVANIRPYLKRDMDTERFAESLFNYQLESDPENTVHIFDDAEIGAITKLAEEKFSTWEWRFGYSPKYIFRNEWADDESSIQIELQVEKGIIVLSLCAGFNFTPRIIDQLNWGLTGRRHCFEDVSEVVKHFISNSTEDMVYSFF